MQERRAQLEAELQTAKRIRGDLQDLKEIRDSFAEGQHFYELLRPMNLDGGLDVVEDQIQTLQESLKHE